MPGRLLFGGRDEDDDGLMCILVLIPQQCLKPARALRRIARIGCDCERGWHVGVGVFRTESVYIRTQVAECTAREVAAL